MSKSIWHTWLIQANLYNTDQNQLQLNTDKKTCKIEISCPNYTTKMHPLTRRKEMNQELTNSVAASRRALLTQCRRPERCRGGLLILICFKLSRVSEFSLTIPIENAINQSLLPKKNKINQFLWPFSLPKHKPNASQITPPTSTNSIFNYSQPMITRLNPCKKSQWFSNQLKLYSLIQTKAIRYYFFIISEIFKMHPSNPYELTPKFN